MRIAVIGGGISGMASAWLLQSRHEVVLYERAEHLGGHARTIPVTWDGKVVHTETGFKYFIDASYPLFLSLLARLGVAYHSRRSTLTVVRPGGRALVAPPRGPLQLARLLNSSFDLRGLFGLRRYMHSAESLVASQDWSVSAREHARRLGCSEHVIDGFIVPLLSASWGAPLQDMSDFPAYTILKTMRRSKDGSISYLEIEGGISVYINALARLLTDLELCLKTDVKALRRAGKTLLVLDSSGKERSFDAVVLATSALAAARLTAEVSEAHGWHDILSRFRYFPTTITVHSDESYMPTRRGDWSVINHFLDEEPWMSEWSGWRQNVPVFRTWLPKGRAEPRNLHHRHEFEHLIVTPSSEALQKRIAALQGEAGIHVAGMYTNDADNHESALTSALLIARSLAPDAPELLNLDQALAARLKA